MAIPEKTIEYMRVQPLARQSPPAPQPFGGSNTVWLGRSRNFSTAAPIALAALLLATTIAHFVYRAGEPLWLDEVWTGMIASQRSFSDFVRQCYLDVNAPLYYVVAWLWEPFGGLSDKALRAPSAIFASLAPLIALAPSRRLSPSLRAIWAALLACWLPGFIFATEARCYSLVLCLGVANALLFSECLESPRLGPAFAWAAISSLLILTHYFATPLIACQGVVYLFVWRRQALRVWPALAPFFPTCAELAWHAAILRGFAQAGPADSPAFRLQDVPDTVEFLLGGAPVVWILVMCLLAGLLARRLQKVSSSASAPPLDDSDRKLWVVAATSFGSVAFCVAAYQVCLTSSWMRPMLVVRYFTAAVPGVLLGMALLVRRVAALWRPTVVIVLGAQAAIAFALLLRGPPTAQPISFEQASEALMRSGVKQVEFLWDDRGATAGAKDGRDQDAFSKVGGFFFHRAGLTIHSDNVSLISGQDPNLVLLARAKRDDTAILWLYNTDVGSTAALKFPPRITQIDPRWRCRDFGAGGTHALTCVKDRAP